MTGVGKEVGCGPGSRGRARAQRYHAPEVLSWTSGMEELPCPEAGVVAPEVVMSTEPPAPSLVDRYFTRWYKAGKCGMVVSSALPHRVDAAGTSATRCKPPVLFLEFPSLRITGSISDVGSAVPYAGCWQERT